MPGEPQVQALSEIVAYLEQQLRHARDDHAATVAQIDQLRRSLHDLSEEQERTRALAHEAGDRVKPMKGMPDVLMGLARSVEGIRQASESNRAAVEHDLRLLRSETETIRAERGDAIRRIDDVARDLQLVSADTAQAQSQALQLGQVMQTVLEGQREVGARVEHLALRLERATEVNRDMEQRIRTEVVAEMDERAGAIFERLQVVGEMIRRNDDLLREVAAEQTMRGEVLESIRVWREEHLRIDSRLNTLEESSDDVLGRLEKITGQIALVEGRHAGLGERVAAMRRDIAEVVDHVTGEFQKFNQIVERQRRKQIDVMEQELRELKFHAFRTPEEP